MNNKLKFKIGRIRNAVIVIPVNVPAWAKDRGMLVSNGHYCISSNIVPSIQIMSTEMVIPRDFDINKNFVSCYEFRDEEGATRWIANISNLIKDANSMYSNDTNNESMKTDILWNIIY